MFVTMADIRNRLQRLERLASRKRNDAISVDNLISKLKKRSTTAFHAIKVTYIDHSSISYKIDMFTAGGVPDSTGFGFALDDFFLVIMTDFMISMLKKYGSLLAIDATHNTTPYGYKLIALMVVDTATNAG